jgi:EmrB/QacA subfamily drug resistance transporter
LWHSPTKATPSGCRWDLPRGEETNETNVAAPPTVAPALSPGARTIAFLVLLMGGFLPPVDFFIVNVSLSSIHASLGATPAELQLVVSGYAAGYAVLLITGGRLGDLYGRRLMFLVGMAGFTLSNALCGLAPSAPVLVAGRVVLGVAAALLVPQVLASIRALYPHPRELSRALGGYGVMMGLAAAIGQFAGGALVQWNPLGLGWRVVFLIKLPISLAIMLAAWLVVPETSGRQRLRLDLGGAALVSLALACLVVPLSEGRDQGWPLWVFAAMASVPLWVAWFLRHEDRLAARGGMPLIDLALFAIASFRRGVLVATLFFFTTSFYVLFSLYVQEGRGTDPLQTGLAIMPYGIGLFFGPLASAPLVRLRPKLLAIGMAIQVAGYAAVAAAVALDLPGWPTTLAVLVAGFGQGIAFPRLYNTVLGEVPPHQAGLAAGIVNSALQVGAAVSIAGIGSLFFSLLGPAPDERAYALAFAVAQTLLTLALLAAALIAIPPRAPALLQRRAG